MYQEDESYLYKEKRRSLKKPLVNVKVQIIKTEAVTPAEVFKKIREQLSCCFFKVHEIWYPLRLLLVKQKWPMGTALLFVLSLSFRVLAFVHSQWQTRDASLNLIGTQMWRFCAQF